MNKVDALEACESISGDEVEKRITLLLRKFGNNEGENMNIYNNHKNYSTAC